MIVRKATYDKAQTEIYQLRLLLAESNQQVANANQNTREALSAYESLKKVHTKLTNMWETLVAEINDKGGRQFLDNARMIPDTTLTKEEIGTLIRMAHPDRNPNNPHANAITQKLIAMR